MEYAIVLVRLDIMSASEYLYNACVLSGNSSDKIHTNYADHRPNIYHYITNTNYTIYAKCNNYY